MSFTKQLSLIALVFICLSPLTSCKHAGSSSELSQGPGLMAPLLPHEGPKIEDAGNEVTEAMVQNAAREVKRAPGLFALNRSKKEYRLLVGEYDNVYLYNTSKIHRPNFLTWIMTSSGLDTAEKEKDPVPVGQKFQSGYIALFVRAAETDINQYVGSINLLQLKDKSDVVIVQIADGDDGGFVLKTYKNNAWEEVNPQK